MEQKISDLQPGMIMLVVKNDNGTFSPLGMSKRQGSFLYRCIATMSDGEPLVRDRNTELVIKCSDDEKTRDNSNGDNQ